MIYIRTCGVKIVNKACKVGTGDPCAIPSNFSSPVNSTVLYVTNRHENVSFEVNLSRDLSGKLLFDSKWKVP